MQREPVSIRNRDCCGRTNIAAAVLLGGPGATSLGVAIHADYVIEITLAHFLRRMRPQDVGDRTRQRHRTVQADVGLREQEPMVNVSR